MPNLQSSKWHLNTPAVCLNLFPATNGIELNKAKAAGGEEKSQATN